MTSRADTQGTGTEIECEVELTLEHGDFVMQNHRVYGTSVLPGVAFLDVALRALAALGEDTGALEFRDVFFTEVVTTAPGHDRDLRVTVTREAGGTRTVRAESRPAGEPGAPWAPNVTATVVPAEGDGAAPAALADVARVAPESTMADLYAQARSEGIVHGPAMRCVGAVRRHGGALLAELSLDPSAPPVDGFALHPAVTDAATVAAFGQLPSTGEPFVPFHVRRVRAHRPLPARCRVLVPEPERFSPSGDLLSSSFTVLAADSGEVLAEVDHLQCKRIRHPELITVPAEPAPAEPVPAEGGEAAAVTVLRRAIARRLGTDPADVDPARGFYDQGLDSVALLAIGRELEEWLGTSLYPTLLFEYPDIARLAVHLAAEYDVPAPPADVPAPQVTETCAVEAVCYRPHWVARPTPPGGAARPGLIVDLGTGAGAELAARTDAAVVDGPAATDRAALRAALPQGESPVVVALLVPGDGVAAEDVYRAWAACAAAAAAARLKARVMLVHDAAGTTAAACGAVAAAMRTAAAELPMLTGRVVGVPAAVATDPGALLDVVRAEAGDEDAVAEVRRDGNGRRLVRGLRRWEPPEARPALRAGGRYVVTGGAGAIGRLLTEWLLDRYAARVAVVGRRDADDALAAQLDRWTAAGGDVRYLRADVTDPAELSDALDEARATLGGVDGVFHCAGIVRDAVLPRQRRRDVLEVLAPKVAGTAVLRRLTAGDDLDMLVLFSSLSAELPNPGQSAYAFANSLLDHVAEEAAPGPRVLSIGWPLWAESGMGTGGAGTAMPTATGLHILERLLAGDAGAVTVAYGEPVPTIQEREEHRTPAPVVRGPEPAGPEPMAIVGLAGRYPGAASLEEFWEHLRDGVDAVTEIPRDRWDPNERFDPQAGRPGHTYGRWGGFLDRIDGFDAAFFGISRREAELMDPQERLFLATCWHAMEDAGHPSGSLAGAPIGVFVGVMWNHYTLVDPGPEGVRAMAMHSAIANRVSYVLDLRGPSMAIDTACSSSLSALHLAAESLRRGECRGALAGGVNLAPHPDKWLQLAEGRFLSLDGRCRAFGEGASGYVPGEGVGAVLIRPLADALADRDHVYGVILGSWLNHSGRTGGFTVPTPAAQAEVVRAALERAGVDAATVGYVEAHGTGTSLGDPIEIDGLARAFGTAGGRRHVGSVKSAIGHLEGAAGIAALTKVLLQLRHRTIAPSLHAERLNPALDLDAAGLEVPRSATPWEPRGGAPLRAGISGFGAGGSNAHVVVEEPPALPAEPEVPGPHAVVLSARTDEALAAYAGRLAEALRPGRGGDAVLEEVAAELSVPAAVLDPAETLGDLGLDPTGLVQVRERLRDAGLDASGVHLDSRVGEVTAGIGGPSLADVAWTLQVGRRALPRRLAVVTGVRAELLAALDRAARGEPLDVPRGTGELEDAARCWVAGEDIDWQRLHDGPRCRVPLPGYPFEEQRYWNGAWRRTTSEPAPVAAPEPEPIPAPESEPMAGTSGVEELVARTLGEELYLSPEEIDHNTSFRDLGIDSLTADFMRTRLEELLGVEVPSVAVYDHPSVTRLAAFLIEAGASVPNEPQPQPKPVATVREPGGMDEIAVIGLSVTAPDAPDAETFWHNLRAGHCSIADVPAGRLDLASVYTPGRPVPGRTVTTAGAVLDHVDRFDASFFSLSPLEAEAMDPQQRLFLTEAWRALEHAGHAAPAGEPRRTGVFVGTGVGDYARLLAEHGTADSAQAFLGTSPSILAARIAYLLNLTGPTISVDTACSSSLVAVQLACESLRRGECDAALAGGVALMLTPQLHVRCSQVGMLSPTGRCRPFDAEADGTALGEAVGVVVLKRLDRALADGDTVHAVIRAVGINGDGRTNGITAPSSASQQRLLEDVHRHAGVRPGEIGLVEAHGTGTPLGDPIEFAALAEVLGRDAPEGYTCALGSVKGNVGHTTMAAGVLGLIKVVLALTHRELPPSAGFERPNPRLDVTGSPFMLPTEARPWPAPEHGARTTTVSSFGFSGTNCHLVVSEAPAARPHPGDEGDTPEIVPVSARTDEELAEAVRRLADDLDPAVPLADVALTLATGRRHHPVRAAFTACTTAELLEALRAWPAAAEPADPDAARWLAGESVDWAARCAGRDARRIPLPPTAFRDERHWPAALERATGDGSVVLRPDDPVIGDHVVAGTPMLPAAGSVALAASTAVRAGHPLPLRLAGPRWLRPVRCAEAVTVRATLEGSRFELLEGTDRCVTATLDGVPASVTPLDLAAVRARCVAVTGGSELRERFAAAGLRYGPAYALLREVATGEGESLGTLDAPAAAGPHDSPVHGAVLDAALQACATLVSGEGTAVPFAADAVEVHAPLAGAVHAHAVRRATDALDVAVTDAAGAVLLRVVGLVLRELRGAEQGDTEQGDTEQGDTEQGDTEPLRILTPATEAAPEVAVPTRPPAVFVLHGPRAEDTAAALAGHHTAVGAAVTRRRLDDPGDLAAVPQGGRVYLVPGGASAAAAVTALARSAAGAGLEVAAVVDAADPADAAAIGLVRSLRAERPTWRVGVVDTTLPASAAALAGEPLVEPVVRLRDGRRHRPALHEIRPDPAPVVRPGDHVLIVGGAGGLGSGVSRRLAADGARLTWVGRRPEDDAIRRRMAEVGSDVAYVQADVTDEAALRAAVLVARQRFGPVSGAVHAAGELADRPLAALDPGEAERAVEAKLAGLLAFARVLAEERPAFAVVFSSAVAWLDSEGQGAYAAAATAVGALAARLTEGTGVPLSVIDWGWWGERGLAADPAQRDLLLRTGVRSIGADEGCAAFCAVVAAGLRHAVVLKATPEWYRRAGIDGATPQSAAPTAAPSAVDASDAQDYVRRIFTEVLHHRERDLAPAVTFENFGIDSVVSLDLVARFERDLGPLPSTLLFEHTTIEALAAHLAAQYGDRLLPRGPAAQVCEPVPAAEGRVDGMPAGEEIAIVGVAGRFPGAPDLDAFWDQLREGRSGVTTIPADRWDWRLYFDPAPGRPDRTYSRWGGFLTGVDRFDAEFFGILPSVAVDMDPQERLFLETSWELLDRAGYLGEHVRERDTGVFVGVMYGTYGELGATQWPAGQLSGAHTAYWSIANRVSYQFDFSGPSYAVDSACSSSLTALHLACEALRRGDCRMAVAGGANLILHPSHHVSLSALTMLSPDGACKSFDAAADGYVPGEGVGAVLLKPLADALASGDDIWAVVKGGALTAGGKTSGFTVPNPRAQGRAIARALRRASVDPATVGYVEAHGTGTELGDPIEVAGLIEGYGARAEGCQPGFMGSVKSNVGHLESAAGIAGLTKVLLQLRHRHIAPTAGLRQINPRIDLVSAPFHPVTSLVEWPEPPGGGPRRAGVSSFGAGGANAHVVVEEHRGTGHPVLDRPQLVVLSARDEEILRDTAREVARFARDARHADGRPATLASIAWTTQLGRVPEDLRLSVTAADLPQLAERLDRYAASGEPGEGCALGRARSGGVDLAAGALAERDLDAVARAWVRGAAVNWRELWPGGSPGRVTLPGNRLRGRSFWLRVIGPTMPPGTPDAALDLTVLGAAAEEHRVAGRRWLPAAGAVALALHELDRAGVAPAGLRDLRWLAPLDLDDCAGTVRLCCGVEEVALLDGDRLLFTARRGEPAPGDATGVVDAALPHSEPRRVEGAELYRCLREGGVEHGPALRPVVEATVTGDVAVATLDVTAPDGTAPHGPARTAALLDGAFCVTALVADVSGTWVPAGARRVRRDAAPPRRCVAIVRRTGGSAAELAFDVRLLDGDTEVLRVEGLRIARVGGAPVAPAEAAPPGVRFAAPRWELEELPAGRRDLRRVLVTGGTPDLTARLAAALGPHVAVAGATAGASLDDRGGALALLTRPFGGDMPDALVLVFGALSDPLSTLLGLAAAALDRPGRPALRIAVAGDPADPVVAGLGGALRTIVLEHSGATAVLAGVDLATADGAADLAAELLADGDAVVTTRRVAGREVRRLRPVECPAGGGVTVRPGATYLVTGGTGALGLATARMLAEAGAGAVVLAGRSEPDAARLARIEAFGGRYLRADVSDPDDVRRLVREVTEAHGTLAGVVHAAGVLRDSRLVRKTDAEVADVLGPKVTAARVLDEVTAHLDLDFLVLYSSVTAEIGNPGQVDYAYANAWLDAFAAQRDRRTLSVGWSLWREGGMGLSDDMVDAVARRSGTQPLETGAALAALRAALAGDLPHVVITGAEVPAERVMPSGAHGATGEVRVEDVVRVLREVAAGFLLLDPDDVDPAAELMDLGFDSITLTRLVNDVNDRYGLDLLPTVLFECPTLDEFADHLVKHHAAKLAPVRPEREPEPVAVTEPALGPGDPAGAMAIVGMAVELPGADDAEDLWRLLLSGEEAVGPVPADRPQLAADERLAGTRGGFLRDVHGFDHARFGVSPREAALMDPQQRLFLQAAWRCIEDAGRAPSSLAGSRTGVFAGVATNDHQTLLTRHGVATEAHTATGVAHAVLPNRVSHVLDLRGPSEAVDTACSSALVALHRAVMAIGAGECDAAIAGGVNVLLDPEVFVSFADAGMLSPDSRCKTFDASADGYARGEGVGAFLLKPLERALADGDPIHAIVRGSAVNHTGRSASLTAPHPLAQAAVVAETHRRGGTSPASVGYIETHGTGTRLGDPVEIEGLKKAFDGVGAGEGTVLLGSVKSAVGHLEAAAGVAGLVAAVLALRHGTVPPTRNVTRVNPMLCLDGTPFRLALEATPWPATTGEDGRPVRRAGVSSFGFGGTNAHVVLEAAPERPRPQADDAEHEVPLAAPDAERLAAYAARLADALDERSEKDLAGIALTLQGRERFAERAVVVAWSVDDLVAGLRHLAGQGATTVPVRRGTHATWPEPAPAQGVHRLSLPGVPFERVPFPTPQPTEDPVDDTPRPATAPAVRPRVTLVPLGHAAPAPEPAPDPAPAPEPIPAAPVAPAVDVATLLRRELARILAVGEDDLPCDRPLGEMGVDSVFRMELARAVNAGLGTELTAEDMYVAETLDGLAAHVAGAPTAAPEPAPDSRPGSRLGSTLAADLPGAVRAFLERVLDHPLDPARTFTDNGLTSMQMLLAASALERQLGRGIGKAALYDHPTSADLATALTELHGPERVAALATGKDDAPVEPTPIAVLDRSGTSGGSVVIDRAVLPSHPELAAVVARLEEHHGREIGLAGRDIAPLLFLSSARKGLLSFGRRGDDAVSWSYVGPGDHFRQICAEFVDYIVAGGWRPNILSLEELDRVGPHRMTATPFGVMQRIDDLGAFTLSGSRMSRLRSMVNRFGRRSDARTVEYRSGSDPAVDAQIGVIIDRWAATKNSVNPYVRRVREDIVRGQLGPRQRMFLGYLGEEISHVVIIARMPSVEGYLLDLEFYGAELPAGGMEHSVVTILETLRAEGCTCFSFGASFGVTLGRTQRPAPEVVEGLEELRERRFLGSGNFQFKNKFRPTNLPLYLCQLADAERTPAADVVLMIAGSAAPAGTPAPPLAAPQVSVTRRSQDHRRSLAATGWNPLRLRHEDVPLDLLTDSWLERADAWVFDRVDNLNRRARTAAPELPELPGLAGALHLAFPSGRAAEAALVRCWPGRRCAVLHDRAFPTWLGSLAEAGFEPVVLGSDPAVHGGDVDLDRLGDELRRRAGAVSFVLTEPGRNSAGGLPMTPANLRAVADAAHAAGTRLVVDATRVVADAVAVAGDAEPWDVVADLLAPADAVTVSVSKEWGVDGGGLLATRDPQLLRALDGYAATCGADVARTARRRLAAALADRDWVLSAARRRREAVAALRSGLAGRGLPVEAGTHCVLLDVGALPVARDLAEPSAAVAVQVFGAAGVRVAPHLDGGDPALAGRLRFTVPVGLDPREAAAAASRVADALAGPVPDLLRTDATTGGALAGPERATYRPADDVPADLRVELAEGYAPADENWRVLQERVPGVRRQLVDVTGGTAEVFEVGSGEPVLFLPPFNIGAGSYAAQLAAVGRDRRAIVVHHPGLGRTAIDRPVTLDLITRLHAEAIDAVGAHGPVHVVGASFGSLLAQAFVLGESHRAASLALVCGSYRYANRSGAVNRLKEVLAEDFAAIARGGGRVKREVCTSLLLRCESMDPRTGLQYLDVFADEPDLRERLEEIAVPTLVLAGAHDSVISKRTSHLLHGLIPRSEYEELPEAGHFPCVTHPDAVSAALTAFFDRAGRPAAATTERRPS